MTKRLFDFIMSLLGLIVLCPLLLLVALIIKATSKGPALFRQQRVGRNGKTFTIAKFRSMIVDAEKRGLQITPEHDPRITPIGRIVRATKIDELPQLYNVLIGEMSFVGPRPEVPKYVALYTPEQRRVLDLKPGITDPASLRYRDEGKILSKAEDPGQFYIDVVMPDKIRINLEYAANANLMTDLVVILQTIGILSRPPEADPFAIAPADPPTS